MWWRDPTWWVQAAVAISTFLVALIALFGDVLKGRLFPPKLTLRLKTESGELTTLSLHDPVTEKISKAMGRYFHLAVANGGWSIATNTGVYVTSIMLRGVGGDWHQKWNGDALLGWRNGALYPVLREVGPTPIDADFYYLVEDKWIELCVVEGARSNNIPTDSEPFRPGRWRKQIEMIVTVQAKSTEAMSPPYMFKVAWDGNWEEGDVEILRHIKIEEKNGKTGSDTVFPVKPSR